MNETKWYEKYIQPPSDEDIWEIYKGLPAAYQVIIILKHIDKGF